MKVLHVTTGLALGGAENVLYRLIAHSGAPTNHTVVSMLDEGVFGPRLQSLGADVQCLNMKRGGIPSPAQIARLVSIIRRAKPAVVQTWMVHADFLGGIAGRLSGVPVCWGVHHSNLSEEDHKRSTRLVAEANARFSRRLPAQVISCSQRGAKYLAEAGYPKDRIVVIHNGIDVRRFAPLSPARRAEIRRALGVPDRVRLVGHLGRADPQKDHPALIEAFGMIADSHPDCMLLLAGRDLKHGSDYLDSILRRLGRQGLRRRILALGPRDDVADLMNVLDVFVLSSSSGEAFPMVLIEAMASGTPCVATDVGDSAEILGDTGWVCQPRDVRGLADNIRLALAEGPDAHCLRQTRARARIVERYDIDRMVERYAAVWSKVQGHRR